MGIHPRVLIQTRRKSRFIFLTASFPSFFLPFVQAKFRWDLSLAFNWLVSVIGAGTSLLRLTSFLLLLIFFPPSPQGDSWKSNNTLSIIKQAKVCQLHSTLFPTNLFGSHSSPQGDIWKSNSTLKIMQQGEVRQLHSAIASSNYPPVKCSWKFDSYSNFSGQARPCNLPFISLKSIYGLWSIHKEPWMLNLLFLTVFQTGQFLILKH